MLDWFGFALAKLNLAEILFKAFIIIFYYPKNLIFSLMDTI